MTDRLFNLTKRILSISDIGLLYSKDGYDAERYTELNEIGIELMSILSNHQVEVVKNFYVRNKDYPTPKVDIRGLMFNAANEILLVKESIDGCWTLPGGWADIGLSPSEVIAKEFREETGLDVRTTKLLAVFDKKCHPHPPQPYYVYKMVFLCEPTDKIIIKKGFDILDVSFFDINDLPVLSEDRILKYQIEQLYNKVLANDPAVFI